MEKEPVKKMLAEALREVGILIFVFAILDKMVSGSITIRWTLEAFAASAGFFGMGVYLERIRSDELLHTTGNWLRDRRFRVSVGCP